MLRNKMVPGTAAGSLVRGVALFFVLLGLAIVGTGTAFSAEASDTSRSKLAAVYDQVAASEFVYREDEVEQYGKEALKLSGNARLYALWRVLYAYRLYQNNARFTYWYDRVKALAVAENNSDLDMLARFMRQAYDNETNSFSTMTEREWDTYLKVSNPAIQNAVLLERQRQYQYAEAWAQAIDAGERLIIQAQGGGDEARGLLSVAHQTLAYGMLRVGDYGSYVKHMLVVAKLNKKDAFFYQQMDVVYDLAFFAADVRDYEVADKLQTLYASNVSKYNVTSLGSFNQELCAFVSLEKTDFAKTVRCLEGSSAFTGNIENPRDAYRLKMLTEALAKSGNFKAAQTQLDRLKAIPPEVYPQDEVFYREIEAYIGFGKGHSREAFVELGKVVADTRTMGDWTRIAAIQDMYSALRKELDSKTQEARLLNKQVDMQRWLLVAAVVIGLLLTAMAAFSVVWVLRMRRMQWKLRDAHEHAQAANAAKSRFLAVMSHELRTPLNGVMGMAQALRKGKLNEEQRGQVDIMIESGETLMVLLNDVLDMSRIEAGKVELAPASASIKDTIERVINTYAPTIEDKPVVLRYDIDESASQLMSFDVLRVYQCLSNLVSNATKFTERGTIRLVASAQKYDDKPGYLVRVEVRDTGIGMSRATIEKLFEAYSQADAGTARKYGGSGLGLSISRRLTELMQGTLSVTSDEGTGSVFVMTFHAGDVEQSAPKAPVRAEPEPVVAPQTGRGARILLVDDHPVNRKVARLFLEPFGFDITEAVDGQEALDLGMEQYDLVLMDINMPRLGGIEATRLFRETEEAGHHVPIIALTADAMPEQIEACLAAGLDAHVSKPIVMDKLIEAVTTLLHVDTPAAAAPVAKAS